MITNLAGFDPNGPDWSPLVYPRWIAWRYEMKGGRKSKVPTSVRGGNGSVSDESTWGTREEARKRGGDKIGYVLGHMREQGEYVCGIDLDGCLDDEENIEDDTIREILLRFNTYSEVSPSGRGVHLLFTVKSEDVKALGLSGRVTIRKGQGAHDEIALDVSGRYYTVTGNMYGNSRRAVWCVSREKLMWLMSLVAPETKERDNSGSGNGCRFFMRWYGKNGDDYDSAVRAIKMDQARAGDWARRSDVRQLKRAWEVAVERVDHPQKKPETARELEIIRGDQVDPKNIVWLWKNFFALGKIGAIVGPPDKAKSTLMLDLAARVTTGDDWPGGGAALEGDVIILTAEDDIEDTALPRFIASGGDRSRVYFVGMTKAEDQRRMFSLSDDLDLLQKAIDERPGVKLIIIDPVTAYLGVNKIDTFRASDLRGVLSPLKELALRNQLTVLIVAHFNKNVKMLDTLNRISDSVALGAIARHVYATLDDGDEGYWFLPAKNNSVHNTDKHGFRYETRSKTILGGIYTSRIKWGEKIYKTANEALAEASVHQASEKLDTAVNILKEMLKGGPEPADKIETECQKRNIALRTMQRAAKVLGVKITRRGPKPSVWELPAN